MKLKKVLALCVVSTAIVSSSVTAFASNQLEVVEMVDFNEQVTLIEGTDGIGITPFAVNTSKSFSVKTGKSWSTSFTMKKIVGEDHNAFNVVVGDVSGSSYKVIVEGKDGSSYISPEMTGGCTLTVTDTQPGIKYTVYIVNTGSGTVKGNVNISSYYQ